MTVIASWNVNSIKARRDIVTQWLDTVKPDLLMLQEIKCTNENFPADYFKDLGYHSTIAGMPAYHGVAILSKKPVELVHNALPGDKDDNHARYLEVITNKIHIINIYAPNGNPIGTEKFQYKLRWLERLQVHCATLLKKKIPFIIGGDFNIIPENLDAARPEQWKRDALFQPESRQHWRALLNLGLTDAWRGLYPKKQAYTFWDYFRYAFEHNNGIRIDHFLLSPNLVDKMEKCWIDTDPRGLEKPSDHTPILIKLNL